MKLVPLHRLFNVRYGNSLELINLEQCSKNDPMAISYVSRTEKDNGISAFVKRNYDLIENPANTISVAVSGSVLSSFLQPAPYYTGFHVFVLSPIKSMTELELLFYCHCIRANKYKYNYGRQANRTLKDILVPEKLPTEFKRLSVSQIEPPTQTPITPIATRLNTTNWKPVVLGSLFDVKKGKRLTKEDMEVGSTPFIGAIDSNNGYREFISEDALHTGNTITVNYNGSVGEAFYQPLPFWASDDVNVLYPKFELNVYSGLFIATIIEHEKYRFNFGRKWRKERMEKSVISLPSKNGKPDFLFMENYIKSLPYSSAISEKIESSSHQPHVPKLGKSKGLSDDELIKKYEAGKVNMKKAIQPLLVEPDGE